MSERPPSPRLGDARHGARRVGPALGVTAALVGLASFGIDRRLVAADPPEPIRHEERADPTGRFEKTFDVSTFQRGSVHSHSAISDGDSPASVVIQWYRRNGYQFLALTDHNRFFDPDHYRWAERDDFTLLPGEEVSLAATGLPVHVNAICTRHGIGGGSFDDRGGALRWAVAQIVAQGGVSIVNHPNFHFALDTEQIETAPDATLIELFSGHPGARSAGDALRPSVEQMWHTLLLRGSRLAPVAVDDAHTYWRGTTNRRIPKAYPGTGWVVTYARETSRDAICEALRQGDLYASNGPVIDRLRVTDQTISVWLTDAEAMVDFVGASDTERHTTFVEPDGRDEDRWVASYRLAGDERFVRARITAADGSQAWTPAFQVRH